MPTPITMMSMTMKSSAVAFDAAPWTTSSQQLRPRPFRGLVVVNVITLAGWYPHPLRCRWRAPDGSTCRFRSQPGESLVDTTPSVQIFSPAAGCGDRCRLPNPLFAGAHPTQPAKPLLFGRHQRRRRLPSVASEGINRTPTSAFGASWKASNRIDGFIAKTSERKNEGNSPNNAAKSGSSG
jgi:hypothetical protein